MSATRAARYSLDDLARLFDWEDRTRLHDEEHVGPRLPRGKRYIEEDEVWPPPKDESHADTARRLQGFQPFPIDPPAGFKRWCDELYLLRIETGDRPGLYIDKPRIDREVWAAGRAERAALLEHHLGDVDQPLLPDPFTGDEFVAFAATPRFVTAAAAWLRGSAARAARLDQLSDENMPRSAELARLLDGVRQPPDTLPDPGDGREKTDERGRRRLTRFEEIGGRARDAHGSWSFSGAEELLRVDDADPVGGDSAAPSPTGDELLNVRGDRSSILTAALEIAVQRAGPGADTAAVWVYFQQLARGEDRPPPLVGVDSGGVMYRDGGQIEKLTRDAFGDRMRRARQRAKPR